MGRLSYKREEGPYKWKKKKPVKSKRKPRWRRKARIRRVQILNSKVKTAKIYGINYYQVVTLEKHLWLLWSEPITSQLILLEPSYLLLWCYERHITHGEAETWTVFGHQHHTTLIFIFCSSPFIAFTWSLSMSSYFFQYMGGPYAKRGTHCPSE